MVVAGTSMSDVITQAGGWLFDRVLDGWEATVLTPGNCDARPLRILGATVVDLETVLASPLWPPRAQGLAVDAELCRTDPRVRRMVQNALDAGVGDIRIWGEPCLAGLDAEVTTRPHQLSFAGRAFKAHALQAAASAAELTFGAGKVDTTVRSVETFCLVSRTDARKRLAEACTEPAGV